MKKAPYYVLDKCVEWPGMHGPMVHPCGSEEEAIEKAEEVVNGVGSDSVVLVVKTEEFITVEVTRKHTREVENWVPGDD